MGFLPPMKVIPRRAIQGAGIGAAAGLAGGLATDPGGEGLNVAHYARRVGLGAATGGLAGAALGAAQRPAVLARQADRRAVAGVMSQPDARQAVNTAMTQGFQFQQPARTAVSTLRQPYRTRVGATAGRGRPAVNSDRAVATEAAAAPAAAPAARGRKSRAAQAPVAAEEPQQANPRRRGKTAAYEMFMIKKATPFAMRPLRQHAVEALPEVGCHVANLIENAPPAMNANRRGGPAWSAVDRMAAKARELNVPGITPKSSLGDTFSVLNRLRGVST